MEKDRQESMGKHARRGSVGIKLAMRAVLMGKESVAAHQTKLQPQIQPLPVSEEVKVEDEEE